MRVTCPKCGGEVAAADVNVQALVAKCAACGQVFSFAEQVPGAPTAARPRTTLPTPEKFRCEESAGGLTISYRWFTPMAYMLLFFCIAWDGFLIFWYLVAVQGTVWGSMQLVAKLFPIAHVAVGVLLIWTVLAMFLNTTTIKADYEQISVRHGPIPWPGARRVPAGDIQQVYCNHAPKPSQSGQVWRYNVNLKTIDGRQIKLISGLDEMDKALFIEQEIERFLDIADQRVPGELPR